MNLISGRLLTLNPAMRNFKRHYEEFFLISKSYKIFCSLLALIFITVQLVRSYLLRDFTMLDRLMNENRVSIFERNMDAYLKMKPRDCVLYSEDGAEFKIHKVCTSMNTYTYLLFMYFCTISQTVLRFVDKKTSKRQQKLM